MPNKPTDIAGGVIRWFAVLMVCVFGGSLLLTCLGLWGLVKLVRHWIG